MGTTRRKPDGGPRKERQTTCSKEAKESSDSFQTTSVLKPSATEAKKEDNRTQTRPERKCFNGWQG
jgi:hypothetical protein